MKQMLRKYWLGISGAIMVAFALMAPVVMGAAGMAMDYSESYLVQQRLQQALDSAALAATADSTDPAVVTQKVQEFFNTNYPPEKIGATATPEVTMDGNQVNVTAHATYDTMFLSVIGINTIKVTASSQVTKTVGTNIELALILDISGSMNDNNKISQLKTAADSLIDTVVYSNQTEFYSKIAIVPYSVAVNVGNYANAARGPVSGLPVKITAATKASPVVITAANHGFTNGETVYITGVSGMTQINSLTFTVASATANTFALSGINGKNYSTYKSGGTASLVCTTPGCEYYKFTSATNTTNMFAASPCVSERTGTYAYTDDPPSKAYVGTNYPAAANPCLSNQIVPLTSDKTTLEDNINALTATGSTAGQVGIAWGWYMLAPNWGSLWADNENVPAAYGTENLHKIAVIMTDGELNSPYCKGVISKDATSGSGNTSDHINCNSTNGDSYSQGEKLCDGMKKQGIEIYTIGFEVDDYPDGKALMQYCATDSSHFFNSENGADIQAAFDAIAKDVTSLYLSQ